MQKMGSMPGGAGSTEAAPIGTTSGTAWDPAAPLSGGPGTADPALSDPMGASMQGTDTGTAAGLLPAPRTDSERFFEDLKAFVADTEQLLRQARTLGGEGALAAREEFERRLGQAREGFESARGVAMDRVNDWRDRTEAYVRHDPWKAVGIAAGAGFLLGMLSGRGGDEE